MNGFRLGALSLRLKVELAQGGWRWLHVGTRLWGVPPPSWLAPRVLADKRMVGQDYHFGVAIHLPVFGLVLAYAGTLAGSMAYADAS